MKGIYCLLIQLPKEREIKVGRRQITFSGGYYAYTGSALNGLDSRLNRHLRKTKRLHWHIDYLLDRAVISDIVIAETGDRLECALARALLGRFANIPGFGASDCHCRSHLVYSHEPMKELVMAEFSLLGMNPETYRPGQASLESLKK